MSQELQKILVPVDYSDHATEALHYAAAMAESLTCELLVVHVIPKSFTVLHRRSAPSLSYPSMHAAITQSASAVTVNLHQLAETKLEHYLEVQLPGRVIERRVEVGHPYNQIVLLAEQEQVNLIVMGTRGRTGLTRIVQGSVAEHIMRHALCPVMTVNPSVFSAA